MKEKIEIGMSFGDELRTSGLGHVPVSWDESGVLQFADSVTEDEREAVKRVLRAHDPEAEIH